MRSLWILLVVLLGISSAQYENRLLVGFQETQAIYPDGGTTTPFGPAQLIAQALGLGYLETSSRVYLSLGSMVAVFYITEDGNRAASVGAAYRSQGSVWVPVRQLAANLDLLYRNDYGASVLALKPAQLISIKRVVVGGAERYVLSFDRDVQVRFVSGNPPRLALIGVTQTPTPPDSTLSFNQTAWGSELLLPPGTDPPRLFFLPRQVIVQRGSSGHPPVVVLDAGHGGDDTGVIVGKLAEKDLTLSVVQRLQKLLQARGLEVVLTRSSDKAVPLLARAQYASSAQVFLSVHAAAGNQAHIYSYPEVQTLRLLEKGRELFSKTPDNQKQILERYVAAPGSAARFAQGVSQALAGVATASVVSQDAMYVLSQAGGAAVMVEMGFESLRSTQGRDQAASALAKAVFSYLGLPEAQPASPTKPGGAKP